MDILYQIGAAALLTGSIMGFCSLVKWLMRHRDKK